VVRVDESVLAEVVRRVVAAAQPEKIIVFGSAARGEVRAGSDLDLLVVKREPGDRGRLVERIYMSLLGVGQAVDVVVVTPEELERYRDVEYLVVGPALREGRVVYERRAAAA